MSEEALAVKGRVLRELSWALSLSPWETRVTVCHTHHFRQGPPESPVFLAPPPSFSHRGLPSCLPCPCTSEPPHC